MHGQSEARGVRHEAPEITPELTNAVPLFPALRLVGGVEVVTQVEVDGLEAVLLEEAQALPGIAPGELTGAVPLVGGQSVLLRGLGGGPLAAADEDDEHDGADQDPRRHLHQLRQG